ncbi:MAG: four helix bundle protein [Bacteroidetes bacterium]|jgi:four helix bundle protein|nr:four helix bundle protein [Bacteroidota bacterium]
MEQAIHSFEDLVVYQKLLALVFEVHEISLSFPRFELYELGSQVRRSSNSGPANLAEGWNNRHTAIYLEGINRALAEIQETRHHLTVAHRKKYLSDDQLHSLLGRYEECRLMLKGLERSLSGYDPRKRR